MARLWSAAPLLAALMLPAAVSAQTADGVAGDDALDADVTNLDVDDIGRLAEYERRFYQVSGRARAIVVPSLFLDPFFSRHTNQWTDGVRNFSYGAEFTTSLPRKYDLVIGGEWVNMRTPDGYWLEDGDPVADANWTESNLSLISLDVTLRWFKNLNRDETLQLTYGVGLGASVIAGSFDKQELDTAACSVVTDGGLDTPEERNSENSAILSRCYDAEGNPTVLSEVEAENIPPILPVLGAGLGLRYLIADHIAVALEAGFKGYLYTGVNIGYFWEVGPRI